MLNNWHRLQLTLHGQAGMRGAGRPGLKETAWGASKDRWTVWWQLLQLRLGQRLGMTATTTALCMSWIECRWRSDQASNATIIAAMGS